MSHVLKISAAALLCATAAGIVATTKAVAGVFGVTDKALVAVAAPVEQAAYCHRWRHHHIHYVYVYRTYPYYYGYGYPAAPVVDVAAAAAAAPFYFLGGFPWAW